MKSQTSKVSSLMLNRTVVTLLLFVSSVGAKSWGSDLGELAASMSVGQWSQLTTSGLTEAISDDYGSGSHNILTFSCGGPTWDELTERLYFVGADDPGDSQHFIIYDAATNSWSRGTAGPWIKLTSDSGSWSTIQSGLFNWGLHPFGLYNAANSTMVFGGGDNGTNGTLYRLNSNETVTVLGAAPVSYIGPNSNASGSGGGLISFDPVSGELIHITPGGSLRSWDTITDTWSAPSSLPFSPLTNDIGNDGALFPITSHGVLVLIEHNGNKESPDSRMWVYKHGDIGPRPTPPEPLIAE
jgi:hypothetical protein